MIVMLFHIMSKTVTPDSDAVVLPIVTRNSGVAFRVV